MKGDDLGRGPGAEDPCTYKKLPKPLPQPLSRGDPLGRP